MWRNYADVTDAWPSVSDIIDYYGKNSQNFSIFSGPGGWADPDEVKLVVKYSCLENIHFNLLRLTCLYYVFLHIFYD